jgi:hypothetical protein
MVVSWGASAQALPNSQSPQVASGIRGSDPWLREPAPQPVDAPGFGVLAQILAPFARRAPEPAPMPALPDFSAIVPPAPIAQSRAVPIPVRRPTTPDFSGIALLAPVGPIDLAIGRSARPVARRLWHDGLGCWPSACANGFVDGAVARRFSPSHAAHATRASACPGRP